MTVEIPAAGDVWGAIELSVVGNLIELENGPTHNVKITVDDARLMAGVLLRLASDIEQKINDKAFNWEE